MTIINTYAAESWDKVYSAFQQINFTSYDYDTVKESLLQYLQIYHPEDFNDFIESSELVALLELFAYAAELMAYRTDMAAHENFITTAQRKQSVLRLAKLISYSASRNIPARGLVKINTVRTNETVFDSLGNNLANVTITWNDPNNTNWKEQFFLVMNLVLTSRFGQPSKSFQIADVLMQLYTFNNSQDAFRNGVYSFNATGTTDTLPMEVVPIDIDSNGPFERAPDINAQLNIVYASDGRGDGSDYTGFLMFIKQGNLVLTNYTITEPTANRRLVLNQTNVNDTDVWVYGVDDLGTITEKWVAVDSIADQTLAFNNQQGRKKYEVETLENDQIALLFGDGNFSDVPVGNFQLWTRTSTNQDITIPKNRIAGEAMSFSYQNAQNVQQNFNLSFSLTTALQNNSASETIEHVRQSAPSTYYAQNRMVNGQDYNTFMLKDSTILKLNTINRTFAGQPKYIEWNDASGAYQNIKLFGDDLNMKLVTTVNLVQTTAGSKGIIDSFIEPVLSSNAILNVLTHIMATSESSAGIISYPRRKFIEDNRKIYYDVDGNFVTPYGIDTSPAPVQVGDGSLLEKTAMQGALDSHWYGEPLSTVTINSTLHGVIPDPILNPKSNSKLYIADLPRTIDGVNTYPPGDTGSGLQPIPRQTYFGLQFNRFLSAFGNGTITLANPTISGPATGSPAVANGLDSTKFVIYNDVLARNQTISKIETLTIEMTSDGTTFTVTSNLRGRLPDYSLTLAVTTANGRWSEQTDVELPTDFAIATGSTPFEAGDAFVVDIEFFDDAFPLNDPPIPTSDWYAITRTFGVGNVPRVNLTGWWQIIPSDVVYAHGIFNGGVNDGPNAVQQLQFDQADNGGAWVFLISRVDDGFGNVASWNIYNRDMRVIASSPTTKFWYNTDAQLIDPETLKPLYDKIRILRSNLDENGQPLKKADIYDCVGFVYDENGEVITNELEIIPTDTVNFTQAGDGTPDNILQFESFARNAFQYTLINVTDPDNPTVDTVVECGDIQADNGYDLFPYDTSAYDSSAVEITGFSGAFNFEAGNFVSSNVVDNRQLVRQLYVPAPSTTLPDGDYGCNITEGLDFMWQHYTPDSNLIDPSVTNIHDTFILTSGYYNSVMDYVRGLTSVSPTPPTPLDLRTSYGYLLENKMLSDTVVLHPGKIKLLFGSLADQTLRAKFRVVLAPTATFSAERVKQEVINVINQYFEISNWDFGDTFYATELIALIHQALPTQIASVVIVPTYSVNSFGSLFTINSGLDEVLQSAATISDVEIVAALTSTVLRQNV